MANVAAASSTYAVAPDKPHFIILDGLRGVAALTVVAFHLCEAYANSDPHRQVINHGYLAVDFFFLLSGFVIAYAYDDRMARLGLWGFCKRRLIRLQPMVVAGSVLGALLVPFQHYSLYPKLAETSVMGVVLVMLLGCTLLPLPKVLDIRGWSEIQPLDGPAWSLFYEYVANLLYALGLRRLPMGALALLVAVAGVAMVQMAVFGGRGDLHLYRLGGGRARAADARRGGGGAQVCRGGDDRLGLPQAL